MKKIVGVFIIAFSILQLTAQSLKGQLQNQAGQTISLTGFNYYKSIALANSTLDSLGFFTLPYPENYRGMAVLKTQDGSSLLVVLDKEDCILKGTHLKEQNGLTFTNSNANNNFLKIATNTAFNTKAYAAWHYLEKLYRAPHFIKKRQTLKNIEKEIQSIAENNATALQSLPKDGYIHWYAPMRTLVSEMPQTAQQYTARLPANLAQFRSIDFTNPNLKTSGVFKELIEGHYLLLENMGQSTDSITVQMNVSTDYILKNIKQNDSLLHTVSTALFKLFEKRSFFKAAAHLSETLLNFKEGTCVLEESLQNKLQKYGVLKVGNTAPDIQLTPTKKLSDITTPVLLVFGASHCQACKKEALTLLRYHDAWQIKKGLEVVYISLDTDKNAFKKAYQNAPWRTYCDYKGWETQAAKDYFVNATPTYILLDKNSNILVHPKSLSQVNTWVNYKLNHC